MQFLPPYRRTKHRRFSWLVASSQKFDWVLALCTIFFVFFGLLMVYEASAVAAFRAFGDRFHFVRDQARWLLVGSISMAMTSFFPYRKWYRLALPLLFVTLIFLLAVFIPGIGVKALGAKRWLNFGVINLQPAELAKLSLVIYLSAWFSHRERGRLTAFLLLLGMVLSLVVAQPDMGTAVLILVIALILYFVAGASLLHLLLLLPLTVIITTFLSFITPYRVRRIVTFFNPSYDPLGASYHIRQVLISLGSGGLFGIGLGKSLQKYEYLPEATTDSIFAIIGEELGFIGGSLLIILFLIFLWRGLRIASQAADRFGQLLAVGIVSWVAVQVGFNLSAMVALLPLTGVPLPFISYGGSSLIVLMTAVGILLNISKK